MSIESPPILINIYIISISGSNEPVDCQRDIPRGNRQLLRQNENTDDTADNDVYGENPNGKSNVVPKWHQPNKHTLDSKGDAAEKGNIEVFALPEYMLFAVFEINILRLYIA